MKLSEQAVAIATTSTLAGLLAFAITTASAQAQTQPSQQSPDSVVAVVADAMSLPFVPPDQLPVFGTFWEVRSSLPCLTAPLPFPPFDTNAPVYSIGDPILGGQFLVDVTAGQVISPQAQYGRRALRSMSTASILQAQVDELQAFVAGVQAAQTNAQLGASGQMSRLTPEGGGIFGPTPNTPFTAEDLWLEIVTVTNATGIFVVHPPEAEATTGVYDLLMTTNLSPNVPGLNLTNWYWVLRTSPGETNLVVPDLLADQAYFRLARTNDTDGDGLSDAIELLVTHTDPNTPDPNPFPVIVSQPLSQTVDWGDSVTFAVQAAGALPLSYQWQFTDYSGTTNINGATGASLTLNNVDSTAAGSYSVQVWNLLGSTISSNAVLTVQSSGENAVLLTGPRQDLRLKGDTTYFVDGSAGPVELYGTTVIEGGTVVKYSTNAGAKLVIKGPVVTQTGPYNPAIFTAQDDDVVGWMLNASTGVPANYYAEAALEIASAADTSLKYLRITYAQTAIHYTGTTNHTVSDNLRHAQILHCGTALRSDGTTNTTRALNLANVLISDAGQAIGGSHFQGTAQHLTVDACSTLATDASASALGFHVTNSIFSSVTDLGTGVTLDGANNGFYPDSGPQFGGASITDDQPPFAPTGGLDGQGNPFIYIANGQGAYYLRDGSPFISAASTNVDPALKPDFAQMTSLVPPALMFDDINSSTTIGPIAIRDPQAQNLGYHYPVVDYVINAVTVNSATLNIDQGTVLASQGYPFPWGIRLNPGGRLNVNGVPTNRVVFAHLEAIQESPFWDLQPWGPTITWRELYFLSGIPTPYPEAKVLYADFQTISGGWNGHLWPINGYLSLSYSIISSLTIDGCHFQGGGLRYDDGGPQGRSFTVRNTAFDRCYLGVYDTGGYEEYFDAPGYSTSASLVNNLFYQCPMLLFPVPGDGSGTTWTFTDNVFDNVTFYSGQSGLYNGPIGVNHHNAYIGMAAIPNGANRLTPPAPITTDPDIQSLQYQSGTLGNFYLPTSATNLLARGSRSAAAASEYHFTSLTNNQKEAAGQVSIGPHYLALVSGGVPDSNGDGIPDFLADRNSNGIEDANENPWITASTNSLSILAPLDGATVSGTIQIQAGLGTNAAEVLGLDLLIDNGGAWGDQFTPLQQPATSTASIELNTRTMADGPHSITLRRTDSILAPDGSYYFNVRSAPITLLVSNAASFAGWEGLALAEGALTFNMQVPPIETNYTIWFFNAGYPKAQDPFAPWIQTTYHQDSPTNGVINYVEGLDYLGMSPDNTQIYSIVELASSGPGGQPAAKAAPATAQETPWPSDGGKWVAAFEDDGAEYLVSAPPGSPFAVIGRIADNLDYTAASTWLHGDQLNAGWASCGQAAGTSTFLIAPNAPNGQVGGAGAWVPNPFGNANSGGKQTWPVRSFGWGGYRPDYINDITTFLNFIKAPAARNFYGRGHGPNSRQKTGTFFGRPPEILQTNQRYRFAFLDGCQTATTTNLLTCFGMQGDEAASGKKLRDLPKWSGGPLQMNAYPSSGKSKRRPGCFAGWRTDSIVAIWYNATTHQADPGTGCEAHTYDALCNWHFATVAYWQVSNYDFVTAAKDASEDTMCASPIWPFPRPDFDHSKVEDLSTGNLIPFTPDDCLMIFGYGGLKLRDYNAQNSTWP